MKANVILDGENIYEPAITTYLNQGVTVGTPSVRTGFTKDVYLTLEPGAEPGGTVAVIRVFVKPMILWLWVGGAVMAIGTVLAAFPGKRRRATDPVSALIATPDLIASAARNDAPLAAGADDD